MYSMLQNNMDNLYRTSWIDQSRKLRLGVTLFFSIVSMANSQSYSLTLRPSRCLSNLEYISINDSLVTMRGTSEEYSISISDIIHLQEKDALSPANFGRQAADKSLSRGLSYGAAAVPIGAGIGVALGVIGFYIVDIFVPLEGEILIAPIVVGAAGGSLIGGVWSAIYFTNHRLGFNDQSFDLRGFPKEAKLKLLMSVFVDD